MRNQITHITKYALLMLFIFFLGGLFAGEGKKILVLNSNASVEKYRVAQEAFTEAIVHPVIEIDLAEEKYKKTPEVEDLLYDEYPDLVYCIGTKAYVLANKFISERDIVFSSIINWRRLPVAKKTYGVSNELHPEMQLAIYRYIFPGITKIGVLYSPDINRQWLDSMVEAGKGMGVKIVGNTVSNAKYTIEALEELLPEVDALWLISDPTVISNKTVIMQIFKACDRQKKPVLSYHEAFTEYGAALIVSVDNPTVGRQAADLTSEIVLNRPVDEKVQLPAGSHIILNRKKADEFGLEYGKMAMSVVNQIVE
ncbi:MAG: hypothetical protein JRK53_08070 [Deltaproteobacteria bacterium]|nr:hypothetical protein [Deltaproteobacteria bacterium]